METGRPRILAGIANGILIAVLFAQTLCALIWGSVNLGDWKNLEETASVYERIISGSVPVAVLYIMQIAACAVMFYLASAAIIRGISGTKVSSKYPVLLTLLLLTNPFVFMTMFTLLPDSLGNAISLMVFAYAFLFTKKLKEPKNWTYLAMAGIWLAVLGILDRKRFVLLLPVLAILGILAIIKVSGMPKEKESGFTSGLSAILALALMFLPGLILIIVLIRLIILPVSESTFGMPFIAQTLFRYRTEGMSPDEFGSLSVFAKVLGKEWFAGVFSPWLLAFFNYPLGDSVNPFYISVFWQKAPVLTEWYLRIGRIGYALLVSVLLGNTLLNFRKKDAVVHFLTFASAVAFPALGAVVTSVPEFDYRNALFAYSLWGMWTMASLVETKFVENEEREE